MMNKINRNIPLVRLLLPILCVMVCTLTLPAFADATQQKQAFDIPRQPLADALRVFSQHSHLQLFYDATLVAGKTSSALKGRFEPEQALERILAQSGLRYQIKNDNMVTLIAPKQPPVSDKATDPATLSPAKQQAKRGEDTTLPAVNVAAEAIRDVTNPYNEDYVLPTATAGTKTDTPIMETPLNVQVISKQMLKDQQVFRLSDALKNVSGVTTTTLSGNLGGDGGTTQQLFLRGFSSETFFRNGFRLTEGTASKGFANVESIEVLKGPAAILYGLVEPGGMVNVITKQPLATPYYGFTQQFGSYNLYRTTIDATGPIANNKDVLYRMNLAYENSGSFIDFVNKDDIFLAPVLKWNISAKTQVTFEMEYNHQHAGRASGFVPVFPGHPNFPINRNLGGYSPGEIETIFGGFNWSHQFNDDWSIKHRFSVNQHSTFTPFAPRFQAAGTRDFIQNTLGFGDDPNLVPGEFLAFGVTGLNSRTQSNTYSTNLDLIGHFDTAWLKHTLLLGGDYYRHDTTNTFQDIPDTQFTFANLTDPTLITPPVPLNPNATLSILGSRQDQYGLYIQDQIKLPYNLHVTGGIRYQYIHQSGIDSNAGALSQDAVTPRVGILWQPKSWLSLYANYTESFGANTGLVFPGSPAPATSATQYEGGIKTEFFNGKLRGTLAYYDLTKTNIAAADNDPTHICSGGGIASCVIPLGLVRSRGPELDITGEIMPGWNLIATWANTDVIVERTNPQNDTLGGIGPGSRLPNVPRNTGSVWSTYNVQIGGMKGFTFGGGATWREGTLIQNYISPTNKKLPGYATLDLMMGYSRNVGNTKVAVQLNINNLLDKRAFSSLTTVADPVSGQAFGAAFADYVPPRTFMGSVSIQY